MRVAALFWAQREPTCSRPNMRAKGPFCWGHIAPEPPAAAEATKVLPWPKLGFDPIGLAARIASRGVGSPVSSPPPVVSFRLVVIRAGPPPSPGAAHFFFADP